MVGDELVYYQPLFCERQQIHHLPVQFFFCYCSKCLKGPFWTKKRQETDKQNSRGRILKNNLDQEHKTNTSPSLIQSFLQKLARSLNWLDSKDKGSSDFSPHLSPLCLADTIKGRERKTHSCSQATTSTFFFAELSFLVQNKTARCVDIYLWDIYECMMDMKGPPPLSVGC